MGVWGLENPWENGLGGFFMVNLLFMVQFPRVTKGYQRLPKVTVKKPTIRGRGLEELGPKELGRGNWP